MAVPRGKHTKGKRNDIRRNLFIKEPNLVSCPKCGKPKKSHIICPSCGYYKNREVINVLESLTKKERKVKEKEIAIKEKGKQKEATKKPLTLRELSRK